MKITVIIPSYKPGSYIYECLESLYNQDINFYEFEVLIILNGCNEPFQTNLKDYISSHSEMNIRLYQTDMPGVSNARNIALDNARGEYICFIDDDDIVSSNYLLALLSVSSPICVGCANSLDFTNNILETKENFITKHYISCKGRNYTQYRFRGFLSPPVVKLIHKDIIGSIRFNTKLAYSEDSVFCMKIAPFIRNMKLASKDCIYYIRRREGSVTKASFNFRKQIPQLLIMLYCYTKNYVKHPLSYDLRFVLSRFAAAIRNTWRYYKKGKRSKARSIQ